MARSRQRFAPAFITLLTAAATLTVLTSAAFLIALLWPASSLAGLIATVLPVTEVHAARAERALGEKPPDLKLASAETWAELRIAPTRPWPWLRLALVDHIAHNGAMSTEGLRDLQHSYDYDPFDPHAGISRVWFIFDHWRQIPPPLKNEALDETEVLWKSGGAEYLKPLPSRVSDPVGRLASTLTVSALEHGDSIEPLKMREPPLHPTTAR